MKYNMELQNLLKEEELVSDYLAKNISKGWLGTYVALAWAKVTHRTLRVWRPSDKGSREITMILDGYLNHFSVDKEPIDIIHNGVHYERLDFQCLIPRSAYAGLDSNDKIKKAINNKKVTTAKIHKQLIDLGLFKENHTAKKRFGELLSLQDEPNSKSIYRSMIVPFFSRKGNHTKTTTSIKDSKVQGSTYSKTT